MGRSAPRKKVEIRGKLGRRSCNFRHPPVLSGTKSYPRKAVEFAPGESNDIKVVTQRWQEPRLCLPCALGDAHVCEHRQ
jgi:hypothetical protein